MGDIGGVSGALKGKCQRSEGSLMTLEECQVCSMEL